MSINKKTTSGETRATSARIESLLAHIARYRLTTPAVLLRVPEFAGMELRSLRRLLHQCRSLGLLQSAALSPRSWYWFLTRDGATRCGLGESNSGPLSPTARLRAYAVLLFCCGSAAPRYRLTPDDLIQRFPALHRYGMPGSYYFSPSGGGCIGLARMDAGYNGRWDRIVQSVRDDIYGHRKLPGFSQLIDVGRFEMTVLTVLPVKAGRIVRAFESLPEAKHVPVHVVALPELLPLVHWGHRKEDMPASDRN